jgi:AAA15 family ATPase/GTPase
MKLTHFSIRNFRSIGKAEFANLGAVAVLIGPNNEGKSNVLRALHSCLTLLAEEDLVSRPTLAQDGSQVVRVRYDRTRSG